MARVLPPWRCADCESAVETAERSTELFAADRASIQKAGKKAGSALRVHEALQRRPLTKLVEVARSAQFTFPTADAGMNVRVERGIAREVTGKRKNRVFAYSRHLDILAEGTEPG